MGMKIQIYFSRLRKGVALQRSSVDIRQFSFSERIVNEWKILSADFVDASSVN